MLALIDNYDSFTYNLVQYFQELGEDVSVVRNDACTANELIAQNPSGIVISPGPATPNEAGISLDVVTKCLKENIPLLGICLGHQAIGQALGGTIVKTHPLHGKLSAITHDNSAIFENIPSPYPVTRYHSLVIDPPSLPQSLRVTAQTSDNIIMAVEHVSAPIYGVQFHPESIATEHGMTLLSNFLGKTR